MKSILNNFVLLVLIIFVTSCANDTNKIKPQPTQKAQSTSKKILIENLNVSFLLDLSDRIDPGKYPNESMEYYLRDVAYIKSVAEAYDQHLRKKKVRQMNDKIQVFFDPEPQNQNINKISNDLRYNISRTNVSLELLDNILSIYSTKPLEIYNLAIKDNSFVGSDTWGFFKKSVKDFCIEENYRNVLVILTDGYIYHKDNIRKEENLTNYLTPQTVRNFKLNNKNWNDRLINEGFGFIPATKDLSNLEILVLGINADKKNPYEEDLIIKYWSDWFNTMKVGRYEIKTAELPANMDKIIQDFILNN